jgi:hypothetical protein
MRKIKYERIKAYPWPLPLELERRRFVVEDRTLDRREIWVFPQLVAFQALGPDFFIIGRCHARFSFFSLSVTLLPPVRYVDFLVQ